MAVEQPRLAYDCELCFAATDFWSIERHRRRKELSQPVPPILCFAVGPVSRDFHNLEFGLAILLFQKECRGSLTVF